MGPSDKLSVDYPAVTTGERPITSPYQWLCEGQLRGSHGARATPFNLLAYPTGNSCTSASFSTSSRACASKPASACRSSSSVEASSSLIEGDISLSCINSVKLSGARQFTRFAGSCDLSILTGESVQPEIQNARAVSQFSETPPSQFSMSAMAYFRQPSAFCEN